MSQEKQTSQTVEREYKGTIDFYKKRKGFGFVIPENQKKGDGDIFIHHSDLKIAGLDSIKPETTIAFNVWDFEHPVKGTVLKAVDIIVIE